MNLLKKFSLLVLSATIITAMSCKQPQSQDQVVNEPTPAFQLEKIIYHTSPCFGNCPVYDLELNKDKSFKLNAKIAWRNRKAVASSTDMDTTRTGSFTGTANDSTFTKLMASLQTFNLDTLQFDSVMCCDRPIVTMIVYYNGKRKYLRSMNPAPAVDDALAALREVCETSGLTRVPEKFEIEE